MNRLGEYKEQKSLPHSIIKVDKNMMHSFLPQVCKVIAPLLYPKLNTARMLKAKGKKALITQPTRFVRIHTELGK